MEGGAPCTLILELRALLPNLGKETELGKGAAEGKDKSRLWNGVIGPRPSSATLVA